MKSNWTVQIGDTERRCANEVESDGSDRRHRAKICQQSRHALGFAVMWIRIRPLFAAHIPSSRVCGEKLNPCWVRILFAPSLRSCTKHSLCGRAVWFVDFEHCTLNAIAADWRSILLQRAAGLLASLFAALHGVDGVEPSLSGFVLLSAACACQDGGIERESDRFDAVPSIAS